MPKSKVSRPKHTPPARAKEEKGGGKQGGKKAFDNTNRGALFLNDKDGNEARPDYTGVMDVVFPKGSKEGEVVKFRIAGWEKEPKSGGENYLSLSIQKADAQGSNKKSKKDEESEEDED